MVLDSPRESIKKFGSELHSHSSHLHFHRHSSDSNNNDRGGGNRNSNPRSSSSSATQPAAAGASAVSLGPVNLAQQYEQDKQKLVKYCFSRYEPDGTLHESYITHVRIIEDSHYPSSRPPPTSSANHKKTRILSLAVKRSGTVRLHKGRENPNGSFQIGRTWNLDELTEVHIDHEAESGLLMVLGKPYYWETNTPKERTVFVKSVCNIYNKFTKGGLPMLVNFDQRVFGDILALGNKGKPPVLRYTSIDPNPGGSGSNTTNGFPPSASTQQTQTHPNSTASIVRASLANSTYSNANKDSVVSNNTLMSPNTSLMSLINGSNNSLKSPVNVREYSSSGPSASAYANNNNGNETPSKQVKLSSSQGAYNHSSHDVGRNGLQAPQPMPPQPMPPQPMPPQLQPRKSSGSILQKAKQFETTQQGQPLPPSKSMGNLNKRPSLSRLNTQSEDHKNTSFNSVTTSIAPSPSAHALGSTKRYKDFGSPLSANQIDPPSAARSSPPLAFKSPSITRLDSPKLRAEKHPTIAFRSSSPKLYADKPNDSSDDSGSSNNKSRIDKSRVALKNDILGSDGIDRSVLKNEINSIDNNGIDTTTVSSKNHLSPGQVFDSPTRSSFTSDSNIENSLSNAKSNRSSIIDVEFKSASKRDSVHRKEYEEDVEPQSQQQQFSNYSNYNNNKLNDVDDSAAVMNEIHKQRTLNKKPSMKLRKSNTNLPDAAASHIDTQAPPPPPPPAIIKTDTRDYDSGIDDISDDKYDDTAAGDIESRGIYDDNIIEDSRTYFNNNNNNIDQCYSSIPGPSGSKKDGTTPLEDLFEEINWNSHDDSRNITQKLMRTLHKTEYDSVNSLVSISSNFGEIDTYIEQSILQCEKLDHMLTFFQVELDGFSEEISYIESQASGLQVVTANKKKLWNDLKEIVAQEGP